MDNSCGDGEVHAPIRSRGIAHRFYVMDTKASDFVLGTEFFVEHSHILSLTLQAPYVLHVDHGDGRESVPLEQSEQTSSYPRLCKKRPSAMMVGSETEDYQLFGGVLDPGLQEFGYSRVDLNMELFASDKQHILDLYCSKRQNCCYHFYWPSLGIPYETPGSVNRGRSLRPLPSSCPPMPSTCFLAVRSLFGNQDDRGPAQVPWEDLDPAMVRRIQRNSSGHTPGGLKDRPRPRDAVESTPGGDEYVLSDAIVPNPPCHIPTPDVVSECGLSELPSSIHFEDGPEHDAFLVQKCVDEVENAQYATPQKPLLSMRGEEPLD